LIVCDETHRMSASFFGDEVTTYIDPKLIQRLGDLEAKHPGRQPAGA
jgi:hypothetical protein